MSVVMGMAGVTGYMGWYMDYRGSRDFISPLNIYVHRKREVSGSKHVLLPRTSSVQ